MYLHILHLLQNVWKYVTYIKIAIQFRVKDNGKFESTLKITNLFQTKYIWKICFWEEEENLCNKSLFLLQILLPLIKYHCGWLRFIYSPTTILHHTETITQHSTAQPATAQRRFKFYDLFSIFVHKTEREWQPFHCGNEELVTRNVEWHSKL